MLSHYKYLLVVSAVGTLNVKVQRTWWEQHSGGGFSNCGFMSILQWNFSCLREPNLTELQALDAGCALVLD